MAHSRRMKDGRNDPMEHTAHAATGGQHAASAPGRQPPAGVHVPEHATGPDAVSHSEHAGGHDTHAGGHDKHAGHSVAMFRDKFWLSVALTVPVVVLSHDIAMWFGYQVPPLPGIALAPAILGTIVFLYGGLVFLRGACLLYTSRCV